MTYSDNRNRNTGSGNTAAWIIGAIAAIVVIGGIVYGMSDRGDQTASNPPAATAGQGTNTPAQNAPAPPAPPASR